MDLENVFYPLHLIGKLHSKQLSFSCVGLLAAIDVVRLTVSQETGFNWLIKDSCRKRKSTTPVFLPLKFHGQLGTGHKGAQGHKEFGHDRKAFTFQILCSTKHTKTGIYRSFSKLAKDQRRVTLKSPYELVLHPDIKARKKNTTRKKIEGDNFDEFINIKTLQHFFFSKPKSNIHKRS